MVSPHLPTSCLLSWSASSKDPSLSLDSSTVITDQPFWAIPPAPCALAPFPACRPSSSLTLWAVAKFWAASGLYFRTATCSSIILLQDHPTEPLESLAPILWGWGQMWCPKGPEAHICDSCHSRCVSTNIGHLVCLSLTAKFVNLTTWRENGLYKLMHMTEKIQLISAPLELHIRKLHLLAHKALTTHTFTKTLSTVMKMKERKRTGSQICP